MNQSERMTSQSQNATGQSDPSKTVTMLTHSASSGSRQTGLPARPYQLRRVVLIAFLAMQVGMHQLRSGPSSC
jgi:hypothetical protein